MAQENYPQQKINSMSKMRYEQVQVQNISIKST